MIRGEGPAGMMAFAVPIYAMSNPRICGLELSPNRVIAGVSGNEYESVGSSEFQVFFVAMPTEAFRQHATALWGRDWARRLRERRWYSQVPATAPVVSAP